MEGRDKVLTPETSPEHETIGRYFEAYAVNLNRSAVFYCARWDYTGFWMHPMDPEDKPEARSVSERVIGTNFRRIYDYESREGNRLFCGCVVENHGYGPCPAPGCEKCVESESYKFVALPVPADLGPDLAKKVKEIQSEPERVKVTNKERQVLKALAEGHYLMTVSYSTLMVVIHPAFYETHQNINRNEFNKLPKVTMGVVDRLIKKSWIVCARLPNIPTRAGQTISPKGRAAIGLPVEPSEFQAEEPEPRGEKPAPPPEEIVRQALDAYVQGIADHYEKLRLNLMNNLEAYPEDVAGVIGGAFELVVATTRRWREILDIVRRLKLETTIDGMSRKLDQIEEENGDYFIKSYHPFPNPGLPGIVQGINREADKTVICFDLLQLRSIVTAEKREEDPA